MDTSNLDISRTPRRRTAKAQEKSRTDLEQIAPPVSNSTPARHRRVISPIEVRKIITFSEILCSATFYTTYSK